MAGPNTWVTVGVSDCGNENGGTTESAEESPADASYQGENEIAGRGSHK